MFWIEGALFALLLELVECIVDHCRDRTLQRIAVGPASMARLALSTADLGSPLAG